MRLGLALSLATIISIAAANPVSQRQTGDENKFRLKTGGSSHTEHNNLYVESYHTGAGASDAVLAPGLNSSAIFFLNGTNAQYDAGTPFPWGINLAGDVNYAGWEFVTLNPGYGSGNFFINSTGLQFTGGQFGGWLACDWWHGLPQLFWIVSYRQPIFPSSCSKVNLEPEDL